MMMRFLILCMLGFSNVGAHAAQWVKLNESNTSTLMIDKQSVVAQEPYKKSWVKIDYKRLQSNTESVEKEYNSAKALWFFDCAKQKSATTQVFQYLNQELVYSAGVDVKSAEFIEPLPDSDVEMAMRYVCKPEKSPKPIAAVTPPAVATPGNPEPPKAEKASAPASSAASPVQAPANPAPQQNANPSTKPSPEKASKPAATLNTSSTPKKPAKGNVTWSYNGDNGPEHWGKLAPEFQMCYAGRNQSPINIEGTIHAALKPIRAIRKFAANDIALHAQALQVNFKKGNMLVLDSQPFQLKHMVLRMPSEHQLQGKGFPLEAQWHHEDSKGNAVIVSVLYKEDKKSNATIEKLLAQLPKDPKPVTLATRITPNDLIPQDNRYYRYTGSLTTPPCSEGVRWVVMKTPQAIAATQLESIASALSASNARPSQPLHGRIVLE